MGYWAERCPGCGRGRDSVDASEDEMLHHSDNCPVYPSGPLELFNADTPGENEEAHYRSLGKTEQHRAAETALGELHRLDRGLWEIIAGWEPNPDNLTVYDALDLARKKGH